MRKNRLKTMRKVTGKTQQDVARFVGITQNAYSYWENGKVKIDDLNIRKLADWYNVSADFLLGRKYIMTIPPQKWHESLQEDYRNANEFFKEYIEYKHGGILFTDIIPKTKKASEEFSEGKHSPMRDAQEKTIESRENLKIAIFGGSEATDEMLNKVLEYAEFIKKQNESK